MTRLAWVVFGLSAFSAIQQPLRGQEAGPIVVGTRVRVVIPDSNGTSTQQIPGTLVRLVGDTAVLLSGGFSRPESLKVALENGRQLEVMLASHGHGAAGAAVGALVGGVTGAIVGGARSSSCTGLCQIGQDSQTAGAVFLGAAGGALLGLVIGSSIRSEIWVPVKTSGVRVGLLPRGLGVRIGI